MARILKISGEIFGGDQLVFPECPFAGRIAQLNNEDIDVICNHPKRTCMAYCGSYNRVDKTSDLYEECPYDTERKNNGARIQ